MLQHCEIKWTKRLKHYKVEFLSALQLTVSTLAPKVQWQVI